MEKRQKPKVIAIVGQTASGKSTLAIELAKIFSGEIIAVDSRTIYQGMDIATAKPQGIWQKDGSLVEEGVIHWGLNLVSPDKEYSAALFAEYAREKIQEIICRKHIPFLVGGTGLWFDALLSGLQIPNVPPDIKRRAELTLKTTGELAEYYKQLDPKGWESIDRKNKHRLLRAVEVCETLQIPFSQVRKKQDEPYQVLWLGISLPKEELFKRIDMRIDFMIQHGLIDEVKKIKETYGSKVPGMSGIGYRSFWAYLEGKKTLEQAKEELKNATRQYAKRQMTWFKRKTDIHWIQDRDSAENLINDFLFPVKKP